MQVIVLSRDYMPLMHCDIRRAMILLYLNKAEIVKESGQFLKTVSERYPVPRVIRLLGKLMRRFTPRVAYSRKNVHLRDQHTCQYCGSQDNLTLDHVMPSSRGGTSSWENVVTACSPCNAKKGNKTPEEAGLILNRPPIRPSLLMKIDWGDIFGDELGATE
jgi:5-methylcytosine-specific restriction endonuclease McrA